MIWLLLTPLFILLALGVIHCCCVVETCDVFVDDFGTDQLATEYTTVSGSWTVAAGVLTTASVNAVLVSDTAVPGGLTGVYSSVKAKLSSTSDTARLIILYTDSSNYWFAEVQAGAANGTLKLFQRAAGANVQKGSTITVLGLQINEDWIITLCYADDLVVAGAHQAGGSRTIVRFVSGALTGAGTQGGLGTAGMSTLTTFDDYLLSTHSIDDPDCPDCYICDLCSSATIPALVDLDITGAANVLFGCTACSLINGAVLEWNSGCLWQASTSTACGSTGTVQYQVSITTPVGATCTMEVRAEFSGSEYAIWQKTGVSRDCESWSAVQLTSAHLVSNVGGVCDWAAAVLTVTTL